MKVRGQRIIPAAERIKSGSVLDDTSGCWIWQKGVRSADKPYGRVGIGSRTAGNRRSIGAHQLSYMTFKGDIGPNLCVCHTCDNPRCVNPDHLFLGTKKDNADDRDRKGRNKPAPIYRGADAPWSKLTPAQVEEIRSSKLSSRKIAPAYGISHGQVRAIRRGEYYSPAPPVQQPQEPA